jgi:hypothetical protein
MRLDPKVAETVASQPTPAGVAPREPGRPVVVHDFKPPWLILLQTKDRAARRRPLPCEAHRAPLSLIKVDPRKMSSHLDSTERSLGSGGGRLGFSPLPARPAPCFLLGLTGQLFHGVSAESSSCENSSVSGGRGSRTRREARDPTRSQVPRAGALESPTRTLIDSAARPGRLRHTVPRRRLGRGIAGQATPLSTRPVASSPLRKGRSARCRTSLSARPLALDGTSPPSIGSGAPKLNRKSEPPCDRASRGTPPAPAGLLLLGPRRRADQRG